MLVILSVFAIVLSLLLVVGIHEAGHAVAARLFKIKINRISIGFGRALFSFQGKKGCQWVWALWPLGGYVHLLNSRIEPVAPNDYSFSFDRKPIWVRCIVLLSGIFANLLTAWLALVLMLILGYQQTVPVIAKITAPSIASSAGLVAGDRIISIAGQGVSSWREVGMRLIMNLGTVNVGVVVENPTGVKHQVPLDLGQWRYKRENGGLLASIGLNPDLSVQNTHQVEGVSLLQASQHAFLQLIGLCCFFLVMLKQIFTGVIPFAVLLGPLGLFTAMVGSFLQGLSVFLYFISSLSFAVALINIFPIPGLDGGSLMYALVEKIRGKPVSVGMEVLLHRLVFIAFCLVLVQLILNDVQRYLQ